MAVLMQPKTIYITNVPDPLLDKRLLRTHFSQFDTIRRVIVKAPSSCSVSFLTAEGAQKALKEGAFLNNHHLNMTLGKFSMGDTSEMLRDTQSYDDLDLNYLNDNNDVFAEDPPSAVIDDDIHSDKDLFKMKKKIINELHEERKVSKDPLKKATKRALGAKSSKLLKKTSMVVPDVPNVASLKKKYELLELRDKLYRQKLKENKLSFKIGTCPDMCPEKERIMRTYRKLWSPFEVDPETHILAPELAVKEYSRSSADQEEPLPHELRPQPVLSMTMTHLVLKVMPAINDSDVNVSEWYDFLWDRLRGIRKDIVQQQLCSVNVASIIEQCARYHILCFDRLCGQDASVFDEKINTENLNNCLQSVIHMYEDLNKRGHTCPNEAEFRAYEILTKLNRGDIVWEFQQLSPQLQSAPDILFAIQVFSAFNNNMYSKFFSLVSQTTYLNACLLQRYFGVVRSKALETLVIGCCRPQDQTFRVPLISLKEMLKFDDEKDLLNFCNDHGMILLDDGDLAIGKNDFTAPLGLSLSLSSSLEIIKTKRSSIPLTVIGTCGIPTERPHQVHNSFQSSGKLNDKASNAEDQVEKLKSDFDIDVDHIPRVEIDANLLINAPVMNPTTNNSSTIPNIFSKGSQNVVQPKSGFSQSTDQGSSNKSPFEFTDSLELPNQKNIFGKTPSVQSSNSEKPNIFERLGNTNIKKPMFGNENVFQKPASDNIFQKPASDNIFQKPASDNIFQKPASDNIFQKPASSDDHVFKVPARPANDAKLFLKPNAESNIFQKPVNESNIFQKALDNSKALFKSSDSSSTTNVFAKTPDVNLFSKNTDTNLFKKNAETNLFAKTSDSNIFAKSSEESNIFKSISNSSSSNVFLKPSSDLNNFADTNKDLSENIFRKRPSSEDSQSEEKIFKMAPKPNIFKPSNLNEFSKPSDQKSSETGFTFLSQTSKSISSEQNTSGFEKSYELFLKQSEEETRKRVADEEKEVERRKELEAIQKEIEKQRFLELEQQKLREVELQKQRERELEAKKAEEKRQQELELQRQRELQALREKELELQRQREIELEQQRQWELRVQEDILNQKVEYDLQVVLDNLQKVQDRKLQEHELKLKQLKKEKELRKLKKTVSKKMKYIYARRCARKWKDRVNCLKINKLDFSKLVLSSVENHTAVWGSVKNIKNHAPFNIKEHFDSLKALEQNKALSSDNMYVGFDMIKILNESLIHPEFVKINYSFSTPLTWKVSFHLPKLSDEYCEFRCQLNSFLEQICYNGKHSLQQCECLRAQNHTLYMNYVLIQNPSPDPTLAEGSNVYMFLISELWETLEASVVRFKELTRDCHSSTMIVIVCYRSNYNHSLLQSLFCHESGSTLTFVDWKSARDLHEAIICKFSSHFLSSKQPLHFQNLFDMLSDEVECLFLQLKLDSEIDVCKEDLIEQFKQPNYLIDLYNTLLLKLKCCVEESEEVLLAPEFKPYLMKGANHCLILNNDMHPFNDLLGKLVLPRFKSWPPIKISKLKKILKRFCSIIDQSGHNELFILVMRLLNPPKDNLEAFLKNVRWNQILVQCFLWNIRVNAPLLTNMFFFYDRELLNKELRSHWWITVARHNLVS